ncbi:MAG TPA: hypothetical protein VI485_30505 [Vicinamibacterales bacterium]|nr:hypothetical protein [Vicinamibacterales bacterium]
MIDTKRPLSGGPIERRRRAHTLAPPKPTGGGRGFRALVACSTVVFLASCGGGDNGSPTAPTPTPPAPRVIQQGNFALAAPAGGSIFFAVTTVTDSAAGRWEASVDWGSEANTLWMWVADGVCTVEQFARPECPSEATCPCRFAIRSEIATPKPRLLTIPGAAGGTRTLIVANLGPREETAQYRMTLTPGGLDAGEGRQSVAATGGSPSGVSMGRSTALSRR